MGVSTRGLEFGTQGLEPFDAARRQHHAGAGLAEDAGELRAQATGRAGDEGHAAGKIDLVAHGALGSGMRPVQSGDQAACGAAFDNGQPGRFPR
jgi:hypothetical protein